MMEVEEPDLLNSTPLLYMISRDTERSRLHSEVCEAFLLGTGAGGVSKEFSSKMFQESEVSVVPQTSRTLVT